MKSLIIETKLKNNITDNYYVMGPGHCKNLWTPCPDFVGDFESTAPRVPANKKFFIKYFLYSRKVLAYPSRI